MKRSLLLLLWAMLLAGPVGAVDRDAFTVIRYDLDVQIDRPSHVMAVTGRITLRNDSKLPQKNPVLQVSSSLSWNGVAFENKPIEWIGNDYTSDIDHTGALSEVIATLPSPVLPGASITLDLQYGGTVTPDATRFTRMGAPEPLASRNDWDQISESFTAVRGLGHVVWYPVSLPAVSLSDGDAVFAAIDEWKFRHRNTQFDASFHVIGDDVRLCIAGTATSSTCGKIDQTADPRGEGLTSEITNSITLAKMGDRTPAFAVADYARLERPGITVFHTAQNESIAKDFAVAAEANDAVLNDWLKPSSNPPVVVELTDPSANPYQDGPLLFTPLRQSDAATVGLLLMQPQVAARFSSPRRWIADGLQRFLQALYVERGNGRKGALTFLNQYLPPLVAAEDAAAAGFHRRSRAMPAAHW